MIKKSKNIKKNKFNSKFIVLLILVVLLSIVTIVVTNNTSFNPNKKAMYCECDQFNGCGVNYKCSNQNCGTCVKKGGSGGGVTVNPTKSPTRCVSNVGYIGSDQTCCSDLNKVTSPSGRYACIGNECSGSSSDGGNSRCNNNKTIQECNFGKWRVLRNCTKGCVLRDDGKSYTCR